MVQGTQLPSQDMGMFGGGFIGPFSVHSDECAASQHKWNGFAQGGVVEDDARHLASRNESSFEPRPAVPRPMTSGGRTVVQEHTQQVGGGRTRFIQQYRHAGQDDTTEQSDRARSGESEAEKSENAAKKDVKLGVLIEF